MKKLKLSILSVITLGWGVLPLVNLLASEQNESATPLTFKQIAIIPVSVLLSIFYILGFVVNYILWCSVLGVWFTYLMLILGVASIIVIPAMIWILFKSKVEESQENMNIQEEIINA